MKSIVFPVFNLFLYVDIITKYNHLFSKTLNAALNHFLCDSAVSSL